MRKALLLLLVFGIQYSANSRSLVEYLKVRKDTTYIQSYYNDLIFRIYSGEKSHSLELNDLSNPINLKYLPNGYYNIGAGVNFRSFGLSLATKVPIFLNSEIRHGETKRLGIQSYMYTSKFSVDLLTSFLKGYYLNNSYLYLPSFSKAVEYQRPDISTANIGISVNYVFNNSRFSYKAAFSDTERQLKNAGSLLAGGSVFSYQTQADSSLIPVELNSNYFTKSRQLTHSGVLALNVNLGYAYSLLFLKSGILTLSYIFGAGAQDNTFDNDIDRAINRWRFSFNYVGRVGVGYRFNNYSLRCVLIRSNQYTSLKHNDINIINGTNFIQVSLGKRIFTGKK